MWIFQRHARYRRMFLVRVVGEPAQKGPGGRRAAPEFQRQVIEAMEQHRRYPFTGPVALDLHFTAMRKQPPIIHNVAKHVLDVLGPALPEDVRPGRRHVLYRDDRQVKFLYVHMRQAWEPQEEDDAGRSGSTFLIARPGRDAVADLRTAYEIERDDDDDDDQDDNPFYVPDLPDDPNWDWPSWQPEEASPTLARIDQITRLHYEIQLQESVLARTDAILAHTVTGYLDDLSGVFWPELSEKLGDLQRLHRDFMLSRELTLPFPALPGTAGASKDFEAEVRACLVDFRRRWRLYGVLHVPVRLTFLVVPPEQGKDLDNIPLRVLPIAHDVLRPHIEPHLLWHEHPDETPQPWLVEARRRVRSLNANSVAAYQVVELPRSVQDPPEGILRVALGPDTRHSWWDMAADYVDRMVDRHERA